MANRLRILLDVDGPCARQTDVWLDYYNTKYNDSLQFEDITNWNIASFVKPECGIKIYDILSDPEFYEHVKPVEGYVEGVQNLRNLGYRVIYVTSCPLGTADQKIRWVLRHDEGATWQDIFTGYYKEMIWGDVLIDDAPHNLENSLIKTVRFAMPWNKNASAHAHAHSWEEIPDAILRALHATYKHPEAKWLTV